MSLNGSINQLTVDTRNMTPVVHSSLTNVTNVRVLSLLFRETDPRPNVSRRPWVMSMGNDALSYCMDAIQIHPDMSVNDLYGTQPFVMPSPTPTGDVRIVNGWDEPRFRFVMVVEITSHANSTVPVVRYESVVGYTDAKEMSYTGALNPNTRMFINSVTPINIVKHSYGGRAVNKQVPGTTSLVMSTSSLDNKNISVQGVPRNGLLYNTSPRSVLTSMYANATIRANSDLDGDTIDGSSFITSAASTTSAANTNPHSYMSSLIGAHAHTGIENLYTASASLDENARLFKDRFAIQENLYNQDLFLTALFAVTGRNATSWFYLHELTYMDKNATSDEICSISLSNSYMGGLYYDVHSCTGSSTEEMMAAYLANAVPPILLEAGLTRLSFCSTNMVVGGACVTIVDNPGIFTTNRADMPMLIDMVKRRFDLEVAPVLSANNEQAYSVKVDCDITGDTMVTLSLNSNLEVPFVFPSFSSAIWSPIVTDNKNMVDELMDGVSMVHDLIDCKLMSSSVDGGNSPSPTANDIFVG